MIFFSSTTLAYLCSISTTHKWGNNTRTVQISNGQPFHLLHQQASLNTHSHFNFTQFMNPSRPVPAIILIPQSQHYHTPSHSTINCDTKTHHPLSLHPNPPITHSPQKDITHQHKRHSRSTIQTTLHVQQYPLIINPSDHCHCMDAFQAKHTNTALNLTRVNRIKNGRSVHSISELREEDADIPGKREGNCQGSDPR